MKIHFLLVTLRMSQRAAYHTTDGNTNPTICLLLPGSQPKCTEYLRFNNCYGKTNKKRIFLYSET